MDEMRKRAYRYLLYRAMLEIRPVAWMAFSFARILNPYLWRQSNIRIRRAGTIADWMHNLAFFSAHDFEGFNEGRFWNEYEGLEKRYPEYHVSDFKRVFEHVLAGGTGPPYVG
jgi:hypothetical protein